MKIRFATSDTETQTSVEPTSLQTQNNPAPDTTIPLPEQQPNQTIFHLDKSDITLLFKEASSQSAEF